jgi:hypothetical protein
MKIQQVSEKILLPLILVGTALSCGCQMIGSLINTAFSILPMLLLISIEDGSDYEHLVSMPLDQGEIKEAAAPASFSRPEFSIVVRDAVRSPTGGSATVIVRHAGEAGEQVMWRGVVDVPLNGIIETNVFASLTLKCRVVEPPAQRGPHT